MNHSFKVASWDTITKVMTFISVLILIGIPIMIDLNNHIILLLCLLILLVTYLYAPQGYKIVDDKIIIKRLVGEIIIDKSDIKSIKLVENINGLAFIFS